MLPKVAAAHLLLVIVCSISAAIASRSQQSRLSPPSSSSSSSLFCAKSTPCVVDPTETSSGRDTKSLRVDWFRPLFSELRVIKIVFEAFEYSKAAKSRIASPTLYNTHKSLYLKFKTYAYNALINDNSLVHFLRPMSEMIELKASARSAFQIWVEETIDYDGLALCLLGCLIIIYSHQLAESDACLMAIGSICGIFLAALFVAFYLQKSLRRSRNYFFLLGYGLTIMPLFMSKYLERHFGIKYNYIAIFFLTFSALFGSLIAYVYGPIENRRLKSVFRLFLIVFGIALVAIHQSIAYLSISVSFILISSRVINQNNSLQVQTSTCLRNCVKRCLRRRCNANQGSSCHSATVTREALENLREKFLTSTPENIKQLSRLKKRESFIKFLNTGNDIEVEQEDLNQASVFNPPAYELLTADESE